MAIEIILRDDVSEYEPHPVFGLTYRGVGTIATCAAVGYLIYNMLAPLGWDYRQAGGAILAACAVIGFVGFAKPMGLRVERYLLAATQDYLAPSSIEYQTPVVDGATDKQRALIKASANGKQKRKASKEIEVEEIAD